MQMKGKHIAGLTDKPERYYCDTNQAICLSPFLISYFKRDGAYRLFAFHQANFLFNSNAGLIPLLNQLTLPPEKLRLPQTWKLLLDAELVRINPVSQFPQLPALAFKGRKQWIALSQAFYVLLTFIFFPLLLFWK